MDHPAPLPRDVCEGGESHQGRAAEEGEGGQEEEEAAEAIGVGMGGGHR